MNWCFAIVNNRLSEIFFEKSKNKLNIIGHTYVKKSEYETVGEKKWMDTETKKLRFLYKNKKYIQLSNLPTSQ